MLMEFRKFTHVNKRAMALLQDSVQKHAREIKILKYIASLMDFFVTQQKMRGKLVPLAKARVMFFGTSPVVIENFYSKFAEIVSGQTVKGEDGKVKDSDRYTVSPRLEQKILYYIAILCLMVDHYDVDIFDLKHDLGILPREYVSPLPSIGVPETNQLDWRKHSKKLGARSRI
jgi:DNA-directed RNA polymerase I subunit RPA49